MNKSIKDIMQSKSDKVANKNKQKGIAAALSKSLKGNK